MTDRELLELAAKAAGVHANQWADPGELLKDKGGLVQFIGYGKAVVWNPLTDDGDALRLAVRLGIELHDLRHYGKACVYVRLGDDAYAATRRAIVMAAAEIGRQIPAP